MYAASAMETARLHNPMTTSARLTRAAGIITDSTVLRDPPNQIPSAGAAVMGCGEMWPVHC